MIRALILDFNGVLVDDEPLHFDLFREVLAEEGVSISATDYHERYLGYDDRGCFEAALVDAGQTAACDRLDELIARKANRYLARASGELRYFAGAAQSVTALARRWPIAICSGALRPEIEFALEQMKVRNRVSVIVSAEDTDRCKPDPEGFLLALDALRSVKGEDLEAGHCLVLEDSLAGLQSAKAAGMWAVGVAHTYSEEALRAAGADAVVWTLTDLTPEWVERFFAPEISP
jgi:HAD superfamily hydrolase (TIGR01509 family)